MPRGMPLPWAPRLSLLFTSGVLRRQPGFRHVTSWSLGGGSFMHLGFVAAARCQGHRAGAFVPCFSVGVRLTDQRLWGGWPWHALHACMRARMCTPDVYCYWHSTTSLSLGHKLCFE